VRAIALTEYGGPEVLGIHDLPDPPLGMDVVLIRTRAAGINPVDYKIREGRLRGAFPHHTPLIPGWDVAGVVEAVGPAVTRFAAGDEVLAYARRHHVQYGTYAELVPVPEEAVAAKPASVGFSEAAGLPLAGLTALQALRAVGVGGGDEVLVHAAAGGVGHLAVQIARALGASRVIGTASPRNHDFLRSIGAEPIEYGDDLPSRVQPVDAVLDCVGGQALEQSAKLVRDPARHVTITDPRRVKAQGGKYVFVRPSGEQLAWLFELVATGRLKVEVAREYPLEQAADAQRELEGGHVRGKLILTLP
jgi:NADPH:quinone reductase-like Zn-dependent oxidoreductase